MNYKGRGDIMTNEELLSAISDMLEEKLEQKLEEKLEQKLEEKLEQKLNEKLDQKLDEKLDQKLDEKLDQKLDQKLEPLKNSITTMQHDIYEIKDKQQQMGLVLENDVLPRLQNIESCYISTYDRYKNSVDD